MVGQIQGLGREKPEYCRRILSTVVAAYRPLHLLELGRLSNLPKAIWKINRDIAVIVSLCGSFLTVRDGDVYIIHQSAKDFLLTNEFGAIFPLGVEAVHHTMFSRSLQLLKETLRRNIYGLRSLGILIDQVKQPKPDPLAAARYSCVYWVDHLCDSGGTAGQDDDLRDGGAVDVFMRERYLYWLEAVSLCRSMSEGVLLMTKLEAFVQVMRGAAKLFIYALCLQSLGESGYNQIDRVSSRCTPFHYGS
jgi:hypothetical protein